MEPTLALLATFGGVYLLIYGIKLATEGAENVAGTRLASALTALTRRRLTGLFAGATFTALLQSSAGTTLSLVNLANTGAITFRQSLSVILGADIGSTITVQLVAFHITDYALLFIGIGLAIQFAVRRQPYHTLGQLVLGFGFVFLALKVLIDTMAPLRDNALLQELLLSLSNSPILVIIIAAGLTVVVQSSAVTIGLALSMAVQNILPIQVVIPLVLGANLGTCSTALISSVNGNVEARRVAVAHTLFKTMGAILAIPLIEPFAHLVTLTTTDAARQVANAHSIFNVAIAFGFLPFTGIIAKGIVALVPDQKVEVDPKQPLYLDPATLDTPALAIGQATRETIRVAGIMQAMLKDSGALLHSNDLDAVEQLQERDDIIDHLIEEIKKYLTGLGEKGLTGEQSKREMAILFALQEIESIGDIVDKSLLQLAKKRMHSRLQFSPEGAADIDRLYQMVNQAVELALSAYATQDTELAHKALQYKSDINRLEREMRIAHIERLYSGVKESIDSSSIHLDVLANLERIGYHAANLAEIVLGRF